MKLRDIARGVNSCPICPKMLPTINIKQKILNIDKQADQKKQEDDKKVIEEENKKNEEKPLDTKLDMWIMPLEKEPEEK